MMKKITIFSVFLLSVVVGPALAVDIPALYTSVQVNPGGKGDVLLAALYDVRDLTIPITASISGLSSSQQTTINIVNTDPANGVMVRVRFRSYYRSQEVLDFHLPLSPGDVFSAVIYKSVNGRPYIFSTHPIAQDLATFGCRPDNPAADATWLFSNRLSIADPFLPADPSDPNGGKGAPFSTVNIPDTNAARALQRTLYGYFEVIAEEKLPPFDSETATSVARLTCGNLDAQNSLFGEAWVIRVNSAVAAAYPLTAISNFSVNPNGIANTVLLEKPNLQEDVQGAAGQPGFGGFKQLEFVLSKERINAQYFNDPAFGATTSVVVTFPTKKFHFNASGGRISAPFVGPKETVEDSGGTDQFAVVIRDRNENILFIPPGVPIFSPIKQGTPTVPMWPYEVNIVGIYDHTVTLPPATCGNVGTCVPGDGVNGNWRDNFVLQTFLSPSGQTPQHFTSGWIDFDLNPSEFTGQTGGQGDTGAFNFFYAPATSTPPSSGSNFIAYSGLPAIGFVLTEIINANVASGVSAFYNGTIPWAYQVHWAPTGATLPLPAE